MSVTGSHATGVAGGEPPAGAIVSAALRICRSHWKTLTVYGLLAGIPVALLDAITALDRGVDPFASPLTGDPAAGRGSAASTVLALVTYAVASAATVHTVDAAREGGRVAWREGLETGIRRLGGVVAASLVIVVLTVLGVLALVLPGIWIAVTLSLTTPAVVLERLPALAGLRRSFAMVRGRWWHTAGVFGLSVLVLFAAVLVVSVPAGLLAAATEDPSLRAVLAGVVNALSSGLLVPLTVGPLTILFLERRAADGSLAGAADTDRYRGFAPPVPPSSRPSPDGVEDQLDGERLDGEHGEHGAQPR